MPCVEFVNSQKSPWIILLVNVQSLPKKSIKEGIIMWHVHCIGIYVKSMKYKQTTQKWYEHQPKGVVETDSAKILWDFNVQTDNEIQARRPDIVIHDKSNKICFIIDVAIPDDASVPQRSRKI